MYIYKYTYTTFPFVLGLHMVLGTIFQDVLKFGIRNFRHFPHACEHRRTATEFTDQSDTFVILENVPKSTKNHEKS